MPGSRMESSELIVAIRRYRVLVFGIGIEVTYYLSLKPVTDKLKEFDTGMKDVSVTK